MNAVLGASLRGAPGSRYTAIVQLRVARLCLDCEEVHDEYRCPACASDQFSYLTRWVPVPDRPERPRRARPPAEPGPEVEAYRRLIHGDPPPRKRRYLPRALMSLGAVAGVAGLFLGARGARAERGSPAEDDGSENDGGSDEPR